MNFWVSHQVYSRAAAVVVIAAARPAERRGVDVIAVAVHQRPIAAAVERDLGVAMKIAAHQLVAAGR